MNDTFNEEQITGIWTKSKRVRWEDLDVPMQNVPLVALTHRAFLDLANEIGGMEAALELLACKATEYEKPIALNAPKATGDGSITIYIFPSGWTRERKVSWIAKYKPLLDKVYGQSTIRELDRQN